MSSLYIIKSVLLHLRATAYSIEVCKRTHACVRGEESLCFVHKGSEHILLKIHYDNLIETSPQRFWVFAKLVLITSLGYLDETEYVSAHVPVR